MQALNLPAARGWRWLGAGYALFRRNPAILSLLLLTYWMLLALVGSLPFIGSLITYLAMPALSLVLMNACRVLDRGLAVTPQSLSTGIRPQAPVLVGLGGLYLCGTLLILGLASLVDGGDLFRLMFIGGDHGDLPADNPEFLLATQLALLLVVPLVMAFWFAPMLAAWHRQGAGKALFFSFFACLRNWRPFLLYSLTIGIIGVFVNDHPKYEGHTLRDGFLASVLLPLFVYVASLGAVIPNASACAMAGQGRQAGSASALMGSTQFSLAALASAMVGVLHDGSAMPMAMVISLCGLLVVSIAMYTRRLQNARALAQAQAEA